LSADCRFSPSTCAEQAPDTLDPKLNAHSKLNDITACIQAYTAGADEALMLDPHGFVATCNSTHFFIVRSGPDGPQVWTSSGMYCLGGITRSNVLETLPEGRHPGPGTAASAWTEVYSADEAFVTGTFAGLVPVPHGRWADDRIRSSWPDGSNACRGSISKLVRDDVNSRVAS